MSFFSPEKVDALIPILGPLVERLWKLRRELAIKLLEDDPALRQARGGPRASTTEQRADSQQVAQLRSDLIRAIRRIESYGCVVKDIDLGLLDFPALHGGKPVFLCWKAGEEAVAHWHGTDEAFAQRKPL
ncbi:MAG: DUF2203 domain-containing protein [Candidatus Eremiobacteraeota bacterium]|nr:DUF2203 domain-containing protein [Candidatus Eremiobacteraeota bacterium]